MNVVTSRRLDLLPLTVEALEALISGERAALESATGAHFPEPLAAPPLTEDVLPYFRDVLRDDPEIAPWWARLIILRETREAVGSIGLAGRPDDEGAVLLGYSVYPLQQNQGIASEAAVTLVDWALTRPGVMRVRATITPGHVASQRVAQAAGMAPTGATLDDPSEGPVEVWERLRE